MTTTSTPVTSLPVPPHVPMAILTGASLFAGARTYIQIRSVPKLLGGIGIGAATAMTSVALQTPTDDGLKMGTILSAFVACFLGFNFKKPKQPVITSVGVLALGSLGYYVYSLKGSGARRRHVVA